MPRNTTQTAVNVNEMTFGIEIECSIPTAALIANNIQIGEYHRGLQVNGLPAGWNSQRDGSIRPHSYDYTAIEIVSPVLKGEDGARQIQQVAAKLHEWGAKVNSSCGFHVHVGWTWGVKALAKLVSLTANFETALFATTGTLSRQTSNFCKPIKQNFRGLQFNVTDFNRIGHQAGDRYHVLNLANLYMRSKPTVEFRGAPGTLNALKMISYVSMYLGLVQKAVESTRLSPWDSKPVAETSPIKRGGEGQTQLTRLFYSLGWTQGRSEKVFGNLTAEGLPGIESRKRELMRLARKYDDRTSPQPAAD